ncbi:photosynthetic complex assembly protein PuhC [Humitalea sp. 24SJ18S-53]|uniref:photosynthetic complex assembly protein PuhC n=1 Tax=Humitalea sp. 24SJ18S-53 TaxID=3422307 RepID=UPI003D66E7DA
MARQATNRSFPQAPLFGVVVLLAVTIGIALLGGARAPDNATALRQRQLVFEDRTDGAVTVREPAAVDAFAVLDPGTNGFIRAALRGMARERMREAQGQEIPFRLVAWDDGRLTLDDPATGRRIDIKAFGHSQAEAFARLLTDERPGR